MTESIKQEIINNIFANGDKLITGPILQTVLIDMIDDVNVKDQEILSKTGSWDDAATQIPNLATKEEVTNLSESVARDLANVPEGVATEAWVQSQGYLKEHQDISGLATKTEVTNLSESVARDIANVSVPEGVATEQWVQSQDYASRSYVDNAVSSSSVDLTGYATETWVQSQGYLTEHQDISGLATKGELNDTKNTLQGNITSLSESVARDLENVDLTGYATEQWVQNQGYLKEHQDISNLATKSELTSVSESIQTDISNLATKGELNDTKNTLQGNITSLSESVARDLANVDVDLTGYATETWVQSQGYLKEHQDISNLATKGEVTNLSESVARDLTGYATETWVQNQGYLKEHQDISGLATKTELTSVSESVQTDITNLSESVANSVVWKKGTGTDSIVQAIADGTNLPTATGERAIATGYRTNASGVASHAEGSWTQANGYYSHAEGDSTRTDGNYSHAEGSYTVASGEWSHAEGNFTRASNQYEHAQGTYNHNSPNQIFSVGAGEFVGEVSTRRNAISVLVVPNSETQINTASFFVQNIGGYDGTNPEPGTNDLATVINNLPSGGGSSSGGSSETLWKKGEGTDSVVQILSGGNGAYTPTASGTGSIAIGLRTTSSGDWSHAEGSNTVASGNASHAEGQLTNAMGMYSHAEGGYTTAQKDYSHAEGNFTTASGVASHAEGDHTNASNDYEHAQGRYNHNSENQIFSIGTGNSTDDRRNVVSVLEVSNNNSYTGSVFVQNVGGYDGTNPTPGTNDLATVISGLSSGGGSSETLWKKGTGEASIIQVSGPEEMDNPKATELGAVAIGFQTTASGAWSHTEGNVTIASSEGSHAEGDHTEASGYGSHAEGAGTIASNDYEHAQGMFNHSSENQIFSVGAGDGDPQNPSTVTRRNAISILAVPNSDTQINTASVFVQNVGGYDGTNPIPGTNDLATVINNLPSGGTSSETWTFTLEDGSTVTKNIVMR